MRFSALNRISCAITWHNYFVRKVFLLFLSKFPKNQMNRTMCELVRVNETILVRLGRHVSAIHFASVFLAFRFVPLINYGRFAAVYCRNPASEQYPKIERNVWKRPSAAQVSLPFFLVNWTIRIFSWWRKKQSNALKEFFFYFSSTFFALKFICDVFERHIYSESGKESGIDNKEV